MPRRRVSLCNSVLTNSICCNRLGQQRLSLKVARLGLVWINLQRITDFSHIFYLTLHLASSCPNRLLLRKIGARLLQIRARRCL